MTKFDVLMIILLAPFGAGAFIAILYLAWAFKDLITG